MLDREYVTKLREAVEAFNRAIFHLPGQHDQSDHAPNGGVTEEQLEVPGLPEPDLTKGRGRDKWGEPPGKGSVNYLGEHVGHFTGSIKSNFDDPEVREGLRNSFGFLGDKEVTEHDLAMLCSAFDIDGEEMSAELTVHCQDYDGMVLVDVISCTVKGTAFHADREVIFDNYSAPEEGGRPDEIVMMNQYFTSRKPGMALGARALAQQCYMAEELGVDRFECRAALGGAMSGALVWPAYGYTNDLNYIFDWMGDEGYDLIDYAEENYNSTDLADVVLAGGLDWWRENAVEFDAHFNPSSWSESRQVLSGYLKKKGL